MGLFRRGFAAAAIAALLAPFAAVAAFASTSAPETGTPTAAYGSDSQTFVVQTVSSVSLDRGSYSAEVIPPPPPPPPPVVASATDSPSERPQAQDFAPAPQTYSGENVIAYASQFIGKVPYGTGNSPDTSFSCDGYVQYVLSQFGISLPRGANGQARRGTVIPASEARAGDLLWWPDTHIAFYDGAGGMLDSPDWGQSVRHREGIWGSPLYVRL